MNALDQFGVLRGVLIAIVIVVNTLGGQTLDGLVAQSGLGAGAEPALVRSWPSAELYVVRTGS